MGKLGISATRMEHASGWTPASGPSEGENGRNGRAFITTENMPPDQILTDRKSLDRLDRPAIEKER